MPSIEVVSLYQQDLRNVPAAVAQEFAGLGGSLAINPLVVVGVQRPNSEVVVAAGYDLDGSETVAGVTLSRAKAQRLILAYHMAMVESPADDFIECGSVVNFVMGWRDDPRVVIGDSASRHYVHATNEPVSLFLESGHAYQFEGPDEPRRLGRKHVVLGIDDPRRNLSKLGTDGPFATMSNIETAADYGNAVAFEVIGLRGETPPVLPE